MRQIYTEKKTSIFLLPETRWALRHEAERLSDSFGWNEVTSDGRKKGLTPSYVIAYALELYFRTPEKRRNKLAAEGKALFDARRKMPSPGRYKEAPGSGLQLAGGPDPDESVARSWVPLADKGGVPVLPPAEDRQPELDEPDDLGAGRRGDKKVRR